MAANGKEIVLVTGANTGLGLEYTKILLREHPNRFHVLVGSRTPSKGEAAVKDLHAQGLKDCEFIAIDVVDDASIASAAKIVNEKFGKLDVLNVNAGIAGYELRGNTSMSHRMNAVMAVNVAGAAQTAETFVPLLLKSSHPRLIFINTRLGSLESWAQLKFNKDDPAYGASKAAAVGVMLWFAHRYEQIKVNACSPGFRATALNDFGAAAPGVQPGKLEDGVVNAIRLTLAGKDGETGTHTQTMDGTGEVQTIPW